MEELERQVGSVASKQERWQRVGVVEQASEAADTLPVAMAKWRKIYVLFGASGETEQDEVFAAVNAYFLKNGCSPAGKYAKPIRTAGGMSVQAGEVVKVIGSSEGEIRQFLRGRLEDSYMLLKYNTEVSSDGELKQRMKRHGVSQAMAWLCADWLGKDCKYFVGEEAEIYNRIRASNIALAMKKRALTPSVKDSAFTKAPESMVTPDEAMPSGPSRLFDY